MPMLHQNLWVTLRSFNCLLQGIFVQLADHPGFINILRKGNGNTINEIKGAALPKYTWTEKVSPWEMWITWVGASEKNGLQLYWKIINGSLARHIPKQTWIRTNQKKSEPISRGINAKIWQGKFWAIEAYRQRNNMYSHQSVKHLLRNRGISDCPSWSPRGI